MSLLQTAQAIIDAGEKATQGPWTCGSLSAGERKDGSEWGSEGIWNDGRMVLGRGDGWDGEYNPPTDGDGRYIAISRQSPEVCRALLQAVELLKSWRDVGASEEDTDAFLAEINKEKA